MSEIHVTRRQANYAGHLLQMLSVAIDGQLISDSFALFDASSASVASRICEECYEATRGSWACCNDDDIAVRKYGDAIYWFAADTGLARPLLPATSPAAVIGFDVHHYEARLGGQTSGLPEFSGDDIRLLIQRLPFSPPRLGLYTEPGLPEDEQGRSFLRFLESVKAMNDLSACSEPEHRQTIQVGLDAEGFPETVVDIGRHDGEFRLRFADNPAFPLWLTGAEINAYLSTLDK